MCNVIPRFLYLHLYLTFVITSCNLQCFTYILHTYQCPILNCVFFLSSNMITIHSNSRFYTQCIALSFPAYTILEDFFVSRLIQFIVIVYISSYIIMNVFILTMFNRAFRCSHRCSLWSRHNVFNCFSLLLVLFYVLTRLFFLNCQFFRVQKISSNFLLLIIIII